METFKKDEIGKTCIFKVDEQICLNTIPLPKHTQKERVTKNRGT